MRKETALRTPEVFVHFGSSLAVAVPEEVRTPVQVTAVEVAPSVERVLTLAQG